VIDWQDLRFLMALAHHGSLGEAASQLEVNRTTVSRRIDNLERALAVKLIERVGRDVVLTQSGQEVLTVAETIMSEIQSLERRVAGRDQQLAGIIRLTATARIATMIGQDLARFGELHPDVLLDVSATNLPEDLELMEADVAIRLTSDPPNGLIGRKLAQPTSALYANGDLAARITSLTTVDYIGSILGANAADWIRTDLGVEPHLVLQSNSMDLIRELVTAGRGVASIPCYVAEGDPHLHRINQPRRDGMPELWMLYHPRLRRLQRVQVFVSFLAEVFARLRPVIEGR
jgi:DNA-binding transcriptional LysR family regulator